MYSYSSHFFLLLPLFFFMACSKTIPISTAKKISYTSMTSKELLKTLDFKNKEFIAVKIKEDFYYIRKDGKKIKTLSSNNEADKFIDGLARTRINGKIGFFNRNLEMVLKPIYDFAFPFHKGIAEICVGCKEEGEEHEALLTGGEWKKINRKGLVIE